jgi:hypothetical protein
LWPEGRPISISDAADPEPGQPPPHFTWNGAEHQVAEITNSWRVDVDWWRGRVWRAYFKARTDTGLLVVIYQDLVSGKWYLQRLFD